MRVVVIEDDFLIAEDISASLEALGREVCAVASSATEAIEAIRLHRPDFLSSDVNLGTGGSGIDVAIHAYQQWGIQTLFVSGSIDEALFRRTVAIKPLGYVSKPFMLSSFQVALSQAA